MKYYLLMFLLFTFNNCISAQQCKIKIIENVLYINDISISKETTLSDYEKIVGYKHKRKKRKMSSLSKKKEILYFFPKSGFYLNEENGEIMSLVVRFSNFSMFGKLKKTRGKIKCTYNNQFLLENYILNKNTVVNDFEKEDIYSIIIFKHDIPVYYNFVKNNNNTIDLTFNNETRKLLSLSYVF